MEGEIVRAEPADRSLPMTVTECMRDVALIQHVMEKVMKQGTHFGKIPGCGDAMTLLKPGAEKLASVFRLAVDPQIEDLSTADSVRYRIKCRITHQGTGLLLGVGVGEASSNESKWKWKRAYQDEWDETPPDMRRKKISTYQGRKETTLQVRMDPADVANTVLKIAKKRAQVDGILTVTAASDIFKQDLEDMPEELLEQMAESEKASIKGPQRASAPEAPKQEAAKPQAAPKAAPEPESKTITEKDRKDLWTNAKKHGVTAEAIKARMREVYKIESAMDLPADKLVEMQEWIEETPATATA